MREKNVLIFYVYERKVETIIIKTRRKEGKKP